MELSGMALLEQFNPWLGHHSGCVADMNNWIHWTMVARKGLYCIKVVGNDSRVRSQVQQLETIP